MTGSRRIAAGVALAGLLLTGLMLWAGVGTFLNLVGASDTEQPTAPEFSSRVTVSNARVALPAVAADPAEAYFDVANSGDDRVFVTGVALLGASGEALGQSSGPATKDLANVPIAPGETVRFAPGGPHGLIPDYGSNLVPGAVVELQITFATSGTLTVPATVTLLRTPADAARIEAARGGETG